MQNRFEFLEDQFPQIAKYGKKAEELLNSDNNLCLFYLGRIAEKITEFLCRANHIENNFTGSNALEELMRLEIIDSETAEKICALIAVKNEAEENEYDSETASSYLMATAQELCEWFVLKHARNRFEFLEDLFLPGRYVPPLANLTEIGREAEENLHSNTRYCLICLGDIGEAIVDYLMSTNSIETHERDQMYRIDALFKSYIITDEIKDSLHNLRMARNKAVHERYDNTYTSEGEAVRLLDEALKLCEWLFRLVLKPGYIVKGRISEISEDSFSVLIGRLSAYVPLSEIPSDGDGEIKNSYVKGRKYIFKVLEKSSEEIILSLRQADEDYNLNVAQKYSKYKIGQDVRVQIKRISNSSGALVELKDGLLAQIPPSEIGRRLYDYDESNTKQIKYEVTARVKWFSQTKYPPMLLSVKDIENENKAEAKRLMPNKWEQLSGGTAKKSAVQDLNFRALCKTADFSKILEALDAGANPNAKNNNKTTALMIASQYNRDTKAVEALIDAGADITARNHKGNTALHFAAMQNTPEIVKLLIDKGADVDALNHEKKKPSDYARSNTNLTDTEVMELLAPDEFEKTAAKQETKTKTPEHKQKFEDNIDMRLFEACKTGTPQEISELIEQGAAVNVQTQNKTTPLMTAAQYNSFEAVKILLDNHADVNAKNKTGNTALHFAAGYNDSETVMAIINAGAVLNIANDKGKTPLEIAKGNVRLNDSRALKKLMLSSLRKEFLKICRSGSEEEIAEAIDAGVNVNSKNKALSSALMFASRDNTSGVVSMLIKAGAYINAQDIFGNTALIYAASSNTEDVVETLIEAGADIEMTNTSGFSAWDYGIKNYKLADTETLKKLGVGD